MPLRQTARILKGVGGLYTAEIVEEGACGHTLPQNPPTQNSLSQEFLPQSTPPQKDTLPAGTLISCRAKGTLRREGTKPLPGDLAEIELQPEGDGVISRILPRKNSLIRPAGANLDQMVLVIAAAQPDPDVFLIDKMLAVAQHNGVEVLMVINKDDIAPAEPLQRLYTAAGFSVWPFSAVHAERYRDAVTGLRQALKGKVSFFAGASGVGKSSVIGALLPEFSDSLATGTLSEKIQRGKHTTRKTELFPWEKNSYIADTPGFSMLEIARFNLIPKDRLLAAFPDLERFADLCRYTDCTHIREEGCGVLEAVRQGLLAPSRHESYRLIYEELKHTNEWD